MVLFRQMKKSDLVREIAKRNGVAAGEAADLLDTAVTQVIRALRAGRPARLPGIGAILPGRRWTFRRDSNEHR